MWEEDESRESRESRESYELPSQEHKDQAKISTTRAIVLFLKSIIIDDEKTHCDHATLLEWMEVWHTNLFSLIGTDIQVHEEYVAYGNEWFTSVCKKNTWHKRIGPKVCELVETKWRLQGSATDKLQYIKGEVITSLSSLFGAEVRGNSFDSIHSWVDRVVALRNDNDDTPIWEIDILKRQEFDDLPDEGDIIAERIESGAGRDIPRGSIVFGTTAIDEETQRRQLEDDLPRLRAAGSIFSALANQIELPPLPVDEFDDEPQLFPSLFQTILRTTPRGSVRVGTSIFSALLPESHQQQPLFRRPGTRNVPNIRVRAARDSDWAPNKKQRINLDDSSAKTEDLNRLIEPSTTISPLQKWAHNFVSKDTTDVSLHVSRFAAVFQALIRNDNIILRQILSWLIRESGTNLLHYSKSNGFIFHVFKLAATTVSSQGVIQEAIQWLRRDSRLERFYYNPIRLARRYLLSQWRPHYPFTMNIKDCVTLAVSFVIPGGYRQLWKHWILRCLPKDGDFRLVVHTLLAFGRQRMLQDAVRIESPSPGLRGYIMTHRVMELIPLLSRWGDSFGVAWSNMNKLEQTRCKGAAREMLINKQIVTQRSMQRLLLILNAKKNTH